MTPGWTPLWGGTHRAHCTIEYPPHVCTCGAVIPRWHSLLIALVCFALALLIAAAASAQDRRFQFTAGALAGLAAVDVAQSAPCIRSSRCREVNPLYRTNPAGMVALKAAGTATVIAGAWKARKAHPRLSWGILVGFTAIQGAVVVRNSRTLRQARR